jgi:DNA-binding response OmpR family regulator
MSYILIAEDDPFYGSLLKKHLDKSKRHILHVTNGAEALSSIREVPPQILILDIIMPGMDGFEVLEVIRKQDVSIRPQHIIVLSDLEQEEDIKAILELGADQYIGKSETTFDEIIEIIREIL